MVIKNKTEEEIEKVGKKVAEAKKTKVSKKAKEKSDDKKISEEVEESEENGEGLKKRTSDRSVLMKELKKKAEEMKKKILGVKSEDLKEELEKKREMLIPLDDYTRTGIHLGTKVITPDMKKFVYRRRADSIGVLNTALIDDQIKKAVEFMKDYKVEDIVLVCKREAGWEAAKLFERITGIKTFRKKYPAGMMTNTEIEEFGEPELVIVCDSWVDRNAVSDAIKTNKKIIMLADTNNYAKKYDVLIPANNKSSKALGLVFYLLARGYIQNNNIEVPIPSINSFTGDEGQEI
ncbi:MAG: 30S ribosomal protein S2 [Nanoarchaeota archaeon]|nr:30S ribosomal protein S2 [Nanoarchaeota archaeon]